jgi:hypothetical protein
MAQSERKTVRVGCHSGFWGDTETAAAQLVRHGNVDYLVSDYLAEVTMSIMAAQKLRNPQAGYATDFVSTVMGPLAREIADGKIKVITNAGGVNPQACRDAVLKACEAAGVTLKVAVVLGDDLLPRIEELRKLDIREMDTGAELPAKIASMNAYLGGFPIARALDEGADVVITGRCVDSAVTLGALIHAFGWSMDDHDALAAGTLCGHIIECGAQCTGGNCQADWESIPDLAGIGYPIIEAESDGTFVITKHAGTGGRVNIAGVTEQLLYEIGDPKSYITPDGIADFTTIQLEQQAQDRVRFSGIKGRAATDSYKVSISYSAGFKAVGTLAYSWPDAYKKARAADKILRQRMDRLGLKLDAIHSEFVGVNACHGKMSGEPANDIAEVVLRIGARSMEKAPVERFLKEIVPIALNGPPSVTGLNAGRSKVDEIIAYWPALIPKATVMPRVEVMSA